MANEEDIVSQVRGGDIVGSKVVLTVRKGERPSMPALKKSLASCSSVEVEANTHTSVASLVSFSTV